MSKELDIFGQFIMKNLRDNAIDQFDGLARGHWKAPGLAKLQKDLTTFTPEQLAIIRRTVVESIDTGVHDFLFSLQENLDFDNNIQIHVEGKNIAELSDGLHGELFTEDGWKAKYSVHGEAPEEA